jgi:hypothetical protein
MATERQFEHEDIAEVPKGWKVRTVAQKDGTQVRVAFQPGRRRKGSGKLISILHPKNPKSKTAEQVEAMKAKAVKFLQDVVGDRAKAAEVESMSLQEYAEKKKIAISNPRKAKSEKRKAKSENPDETAEAARLYEEFHGKKPDQVQDLIEREVARDTYSALGDLLELRFNKSGDKYKLDFQGCRVKLASSAEGSQLYLIGGDQNCDALLAKNGHKDFVSLGVIDAVTYVTRKGFDRFHESAYQHKFGEEGGEKPWGLYNTLSKKIFIVDGSYRIEAPGIID